MSPLILLGITTGEVTGKDKTCSGCNLLTAMRGAVCCRLVVLTMLIQQITALRNLSHHPRSNVAAASIPYPFCGQIL